jgi:hypothetical protein
MKGVAAMMRNIFSVHLATCPVTFLLPKSGP